MTLRGNFEINRLQIAESVNTEINCMQVKNKVFTGRRSHKKICFEQEPHIKTIFACENFPASLLKKNNVPSVTEISPKSPLLCVNKSPIRYGFRAGAKVILYSVSIALI